jgi:hypothetical protein
MSGPLALGSAFESRQRFAGPRCKHERMGCSRALPIAQSRDRVLRNEGREPRHDEGQERETAGSSPFGFAQGRNDS